MLCFLCVLRFCVFAFLCFYNKIKMVDIGRELRVGSWELRGGSQRNKKRGLERDRPCIFLCVVCVICQKMLEDGRCCYLLL